MSLTVLMFFFLLELINLFGWYNCIRIIILRHGIWFFNIFLMVCRGVYSVCGTFLRV